MTFSWPEMLWLLPLTLLLVLFYVVLTIRNSKRTKKYQGLLAEYQSAHVGKATQRHIPPLLFFVALFLLTIAIARPSAVVNLPSRYNTIILAFDISASMSATDVAPSRFIAAKKAVQEFIAGQSPTTRIGLVSFPTTASVVQKPTPLHTDVLEAVENLQLQGGTAIGSAILVSLATIFPDFEVDLGTADLEPRSTKPNPNGGMTNEKLRVKPPKERMTPGSYRKAAIILLSDGEANSGPDPIEVSRVAAERGVRVYTVGIGTREGQKMMLNGWSMRVKLDEDSMKQIADNTGAEYYNAASGEELSKVYKKLNTQVTFEKKSIEITALFVAAAALCAFVASGLSMLWFTRIF